MKLILHGKRGFVNRIKDLQMRKLSGWALNVTTSVLIKKKARISKWKKEISNGSRDRSDAL